MALCAVCKRNEAERIVIRDDYEQARGIYPLNPTEDQKDRMYGLMDRLVDPYRQAECLPCINSQRD